MFFLIAIPLIIVNGVSYWLLVFCLNRGLRASQPSMYLLFPLAYLAVTLYLIFFSWLPQKQVLRGLTHQFNHPVNQRPSGLILSSRRPVDKNSRANEARMTDCTKVCLELLLEGHVDRVVIEVTTDSNSRYRAYERTNAGRCSLSDIRKSKTGIAIRCIGAVNIDALPAIRVVTVPRSNFVGPGLRMSSAHDVLVTEATGDTRVIAQHRRGYWEGIAFPLWISLWGTGMEGVPRGELTWGTWKYPIGWRPPARGPATMATTNDLIWAIGKSLNIKLDTRISTPSASWKAHAS